MAEKPPEEGYISVVDEEPEILELLKWDNNPHTQKHHETVASQLANAVARARNATIGADKRVKQLEVDPFDLNDPTFIETYRLSKDLARSLCEELKPVMPDSTKSVEFSIESKVLATLSFFATGKYQKSMGGKTDPNITQYFVSVAVMQVAEAMNHPSIVKKYIHFPHLKEERDIVKEKFYMKYGIPNVIGCVDCTHVPIPRPDEDQKTHFNKSYHSKKVQIVCDSDLNITSVYAQPGGSYSHDAILNRHGVRVDLVSLSQTGEQCWLIGGPYYTQMKYIMTPIPKITKKTPVSPEKYYSNMHTQAHTAIADTIKHLKSRWKVLQATCNKQFDPSQVAMIIVACCVLHNLCNRRGLPIVPMTQTEERLEGMKQKVANGPIPRKQIEDGLGVLTRSKLVETLWIERRIAPESVAPKKRTKKDRLLENPSQQLQPQQQQAPQMPQQQQQLPQQQQQIPQQQLLLSHQQQNQAMVLQPTHTLHQPHHHEDLSKRPRIMTLNTPTYSLNVPPAQVWAHHYPQH